MEYAIALFFIAVIAAIIWAVVAEAKTKAKREREHRERIYAEAHHFVECLKYHKALSPVHAAIMLKEGESAFYSFPSALYETRAVRHYESGSVGFRVAKGIYVGATKGRSVSTQEWSKVDSGMLTITNKRLIFDRGGAVRTVALNKIVTALSGLREVEVSVEGRQKCMVFEADNPLILALIIRICCQTANPLDLSETTLDITFTE